MPDYHLIQRCARIMATDVRVHLACTSGDVATATVQIEMCLEWLRDVDRRLTRFDEASELCRLNATTEEWHTVSPLLFEIIRQSIQAARASGGLFDPTLLSLLERLGYDRDFVQLAECSASEMWQYVPVTQDSTVVGAVDLVGMWRHIELDDARSRVRRPSAARLDVGGIAKGWAADVALDQFFAAFPNVLIDIGGDMRVRGHGQDSEPWPVGIRSPRTAPAQTGGHSAVVSLAAGGIACSGAIDRWWRKDGERRHHLLDPRTKRSAHLWLDASDDGADAGDSIATATAFAPTAAHAEVAAKVALLRGYPAALHAVEAAWDSGKTSDVLTGATPTASPYSDEQVALLLVMGCGDVRVSANLCAWLRETGGGGEIWLD